MKMSDFLEEMPESFAIEVLSALPGPDRKDLLRKHNAKVKVSAGTLKRATRMAKECKRLVSALKKSDDLDAKRTFLQGWLARRAEMIVHFLGAWEVDNNNGIVENFDWVDTVELDTIKNSIEQLEIKELEPIAPLVYFAYLELPCTAEVLDVPALWAGLEAASAS